jgi:hypothetical protein
MPQAILIADSEFFKLNSLLAIIPYYVRSPQQQDAGLAVAALVQRREAGRRHEVGELAP